MTDTYESIKADLEAAQARMDILLEARAREIYPGYERYPSDNFWSESAGITKEECRKTAQDTFEKGMSAAEFLAHQEANKRILCTVSIPNGLINDLRVETFWTKFRTEEIVETALAEYLDNVGTAPPGIVTPESDYKSYGLKPATYDLLRGLTRKFNCKMNDLVVAALKVYFKRNPVSRWYPKKKR